MALPDPQYAGPQNPGAPTQGEPRKARDGYNQVVTPEMRKLIQKVEQRIAYQVRDASRWAFERQMFEVIAFYLGVQWIEYAESARRFVRYAAPSWFPTPVTNAMKPRVNAMQSRLMRSRPQGRVRPNSNEIRDRQAAEVSEKFISHIYEVTKEIALRHLAAAYVSLTGTVIAKDYFNPQAGMRSRIPRMQLEEQPAFKPIAKCPQCGLESEPMQMGQTCMMCGGINEQSTAPLKLPNGEAAITAQRVPQLDPLTGQPMFDEIAEGELESQIVMPFNFYWDQKAKTLQDAHWCGEATYVDLNWIDRNYPEWGPYVASEDGVDAANFYESSLLSLVGATVQGSAFFGSHQTLMGGAVLRQYQERPSQEFPRGLWLIAANGVLLYAGDLPIKNDKGIPTGDLSYTEFRWDIVPGRFMGSTPSEDMVPLQRRINGIDAHIIINRKTMLNPWVLAPKGSGLNAGQVHMRPGATVLYNFVGVGAAPQVVPGTALPAQILEERKMCFEAMDYLAEDPRVSGNQMPTNIRSGVALHWLKEQLDEQGVPRLERWAQWVAERDRKRLLLAQQHYRERRAIKVMGEGSHWQIRLWSGADLHGNTDVVVDAGSLLPRSRSATTQVVFDAIEAGIIDPQQPLEKQKIIEELGLRRFETQLGPDRRRALMENAMLDEGFPVLPSPEDDHDVHSLEHLMVMKEPAFMSKGQDVQTAYRMHVQAHHQAKAMLMEQQAMGAPSPAGEEPKVSMPIGSGGNGAAAAGMVPTDQGGEPTVQ